MGVLLVALDLMSVSISRSLLLLQRAVRAARLGVLFCGTSRFSLPERVRAGFKSLRLLAPPERGLAYDFINVWLDDEYGLRAMENKPTKVLDVGANVGLFSVWAAYCFPAATIHAYEPNPRVLAFAQSNLKQVGARLFPEGIGPSSGFAEMQDQPESRLGKVRFGVDKGVTITSLAVAIERMGGSVDLLKLDCEGAEWQIFKDEGPFEHVRCIRMEYHLTDGRTVDDLDRVATGLDYKIAKLVPNTGFGIAWLARGK
jgi:FkbM family methyltransferase